MFSRRLPLVLAGICLLLASAAAAAAANVFTAVLTPSHVRPTTSASYTLTITNAPSSEKEADRAKIAIPDGFVVDGTTVQATTTAAGGCVASTWVADGVLIADGKINLTRTGGNSQSLCPGAALTVSFSATSATNEGSYPWVTELLRGEEAFAVSGAHPSMQVDGTAPTVTIMEKPTNPSRFSSGSFTFTSGDAAKVECRLDGGAFAACTSPEPYSGLGAGPHTFTVRGTDTAGNTGQDTYAWTIDLSAPQTTINSGPTGSTNQTSATFRFSATEPGSTFECSLDAVDEGKFAVCTSPQPYEGLPGGPRTFQVRAIDPAGNPDPTPASRTWTIDLTGPATLILSGPPSATNSTSASFTFGSNEPGTTFACSLDRALFTACSPPTAFNNLADGAHTFAVRAIDGAGNTGPEALHSWTIDTRPPTATVTSGPAALGNSTSATFVFSADEPSAFQCQLDGGSLAPCASPASYQGLGDGTHTFVVRPTDAVGNPGASASYTWTVDATAPETTLASGPPSGTRSVSATFTFSATESATFQCKLDGAAFEPCSSPKSYAGLARTRHDFEVRAIDPAGNVDPTPAVHRWTIATVLRRARTSSALLAPRAGARVTSPPLLRWRRVARASYYNVQLYRGRVKVLSTWPTRPRLQLRARWRYLGRVRRLTAGRYRWYVWPGFGRPSARRYGALLGQSTFTVAARRRR